MNQQNIAGKKRKLNILKNIPTTSRACREVGSTSLAESKYGYWLEEECDLLFD